MPTKTLPFAVGDKFKICTQFPVPEFESSAVMTQVLEIVRVDGARAYIKADGDRGVEWIEFAEN